MKYLLLAILFSSCTRTLFLERNEVTGIPPQTSSVIVNSNLPEDSLFSLVSKSMVKGKWIVNSTKEGMQISAEDKLVYGDIYIKPLIEIEPAQGGGSQAKYTGVWSLARMSKDRVTYIVGSKSNAPKRITWQGYRTKDGVAFQNLIILAKKIPDGRLTYK